MNGGRGIVNMRNGDTDELSASLSVHAKTRQVLTCQ